jgi:heme o synthase
VAFIDHETSAALSDARVGDYIALLKPRVMSLVVFVGAIGMLLAPGSLHPVEALIAILCIALAAGAAGSLNMWYDSDIDAVMSRTRNRPIPAGRVDRSEALSLGLILSGFSVLTLGLATNWIAAALLAFTIFFYAVIYTMLLKRSTPQNIVIGGAAGAFPPMVGWAAVTGTITPESVLLFLIIFLWTPPHFWALALYKQSDYGAAGIPMLPNVAGEKATKWQIVFYSVLLVASTIAPLWLGMAGKLYAAAAVALGAVFLVLAVRLFFAEGTPMKKIARSLFSYSLSYLALVFAALLLDSWLLHMGWFA